MESSTQRHRTFGKNDRNLRNSVMPRQRTFKIDLVTLNTLMTKKGWVPADLADKAFISNRTMDSIMAGNGVLMCTLKKIANALGIPIPNLISQPAPKEVHSAEQSVRRFTIEIKVSFDDETLIANFVEGISHLIGARHEIIVEAAKPGGSMMIKVNMAATDLWRLIASYKDGELRELGIMEIYTTAEALLASNMTERTTEEPPDQSKIKAS